jgi:hypothetical protein
MVNQEAIFGGSSFEYLSNLGNLVHKGVAYVYLGDAPTTFNVRDKFIVTNNTCLACGNYDFIEGLSCRLNLVEHSVLFWSHVNLLFSGGVS